MSNQHSHRHHQQHHHHHQSMNGLINLFTKANHDLDSVHQKLEKEFQQIYPANVNPMKIVSRIKKIQDELSTLQEECRQLLVAKQDLIDKARVTLVGNRTSIQRMQASTNIPRSNDTDDTAYANFNQIIDEWTVQVQSRTGDGRHDADSDDINNMLFSTIVQSN